MKTVYLMYETIPLPVISSGGIMLHENIVKAATAARSPEIGDVKNFVFLD